MYQTMKSQGVLRTLGREAVPGAGALVVAEGFYKFHSFTLELLGFLATWYALSWVWDRLAALRKVPQTTPQPQ